MLEVFEESQSVVFIYHASVHQALKYIVGKNLVCRAVVTVPVIYVASKGFNLIHFVWLFNMHGL